MMRILYLSYDGALEPLGQSQIVPYLVRLSSPSVRITLVTFEKPQALAQREAMARLRADLASADIRWLWLRYHRRPPMLSTLWDVMRGWSVARRIVRQDRIDLVHARSYVVAVVAWLLKRKLRVPFLFDMRGFWVDERIDGGIWRAKGWVYRFAKWWERRLLTGADALVSLTEQGKHELEQMPCLADRRPPIAVIPTCVDLDRFAPRESSERLRSRHGLNGKWCVLFHGTLGSWYLLEPMLTFFQRLQARIPQAHLVLLTPGQEALVHRALRQRGILPTDVTMTTAPYEEIPEWVSLAELGVLFIKPVWSKRASCPTKLGEFLACGVPVVMNAGIGDCDPLIQRHRVGITVPRFDEAAFAEAVDRLLELKRDPELPRRCREAAEQQLSLETGAAQYRALYEQLCAGAPTSEPFVEQDGTVLVSHEPH